MRGPVKAAHGLDGQLGVQGRVPVADDLYLYARVDETEGEEHACQLLHGGRRRRRIERGRNVETVVVVVVPW
jgi:hypothetical protein